MTKCYVVNIGFTLGIVRNNLRRNLLGREVDLYHVDLATCGFFLHFSCNKKEISMPALYLLLNDNFQNLPLFELYHLILY